MSFRIPAAVRQAGAFIWSSGEGLPSAPRRIWRDVTLGLAFGAVSALLLGLASRDAELALLWSLLVLSGLMLHSLACRWLIPAVLGRRLAWLRYLAGAALTLGLTALLLGGFVAVLLQDPEEGAGFGAFQLAFHFMLTAPLTYLLFRWRMRGQQAIEGLKQELGQSAASLDMLRAQINPHFLFNALNTLYGTALQENGERTAQGIQMLGDMMRFMLHENHQPRILLAREIEYLRHYIELQSLRIATSPNISIETRIEEVPLGSAIAPMLLIPFVENAFKHGISLKRKSWIKTTLHCEGNKLYFDVYNSTHPQREQDRLPEPSGVGLSNVQQRLALLYPGQHELIIRETLGEYFVHLTVEL